MKPRKILIAPSSFAANDKTPLNRLLSAGCEIIDNPYKRKLSKDELLDLLSNDVIGTIAGLEIYDREVIKKSKIKVISRVGSGVSNIDFEAAREFKIEIFSTPYGPTEAVAELTVGALLCLIRQISLMDRDLHNQRWNKKIGYQLKDKTVLIIGFGRIGKRVAELLLSFGANIVVADPYLDKTDETSFIFCPLSEALPQADVITVHSSGEECILGENEFALMKAGAFVLNAARGGVISEKALLEALDEGKVSGAWIDAFQEEPYSGQLCNYPQVILTPHIGSYTHECRKQMETEAVENLIAAFKRING